MMPGNWIVTITDNFPSNPGCSVSIPITIGAPQDLSVSVFESSDITCFDGNDGTAQGTASGGTAPYKYAWYNASGYKLSSANAIANNLPSFNNSLLYLL